jgi:hypothetical protein
MQSRMEDHKTAEAEAALAEQEEKALFKKLWDARVRREIAQQEAEKASQAIVAQQENEAASRIQRTWDKHQNLKGMRAKARTKITHFVASRWQEAKYAKVREAQLGTQIFAEERSLAPLT